MQEKSVHRTNADRSARMRARLIAAARRLFVEKGYAETGTPEIVRAADVTRGALYHHFDDKAALFRAVVAAEAAEVAAEIERDAIAAGGPEQAIRAGAEAYFDAMARPGRVRLLLLDGPAVLGPDALAAIDAEAGGGSLAAGLSALLPDEPAPRIAALAATLSAGFDRAALEIAGGADRADHVAALTLLLSALAERGRA